MRKLFVAAVLSTIAAATAPLHGRQVPVDRPDAAAPARLERRIQVMGTQLTLSVDAPQRSTALESSEAAVAAVVAAESRLSTWSLASELSRVNAAPAGEAILLSPRLARDLTAAIDCSRITDGAFSPGVGALVEAWGLRSGGRRPSGEEIERARKAASSENVTLEGDHVVRRSAGFVFEEGGFGKGVGLDDAMTALERTDAVGAVLDLGGQVAVWGMVSTRVGIVDPRQRDRVVLDLGLSSGSVATSGNSERGIVVDGERRGHVLDPRTGRPSRDFGSLTVWAATAVRADCLATGLYVLGPDAALRWARGRGDVAIVVIEVDDGRLRARASRSLEGRLTAVVDDLELHFTGMQRSPAQ